MTKIQIRRDTSTNWQQYNPVLAAGELALETDTMLMKVGDGSSPYLNLSYQNGCNECFNTDTDGNFNNYRKEGCYFISAAATSLQNAPISSSGVALNGGFYLFVYHRCVLNSTIVDPVDLSIQLAFAQGLGWNPIEDFTQLNGQLFIRTYHSRGGWTPWLEVTTNFILKDLLVAGDNIQLDVDRTTGKVTINSTGGSGEPPANMVTTDTMQTITGGKTFTTLGVTTQFQLNVPIRLRGNSKYQNAFSAQNGKQNKTLVIGTTSSSETKWEGLTVSCQVRDASRPTQGVIQITDGTNNYTVIDTGNFATLAPTGNLKYWTGTEEDYTGLAAKDADTLYRTTDTNKVYLGTIQLGGNA